MKLSARLCRFASNWTSSEMSHVNVSRVTKCWTSAWHGAASVARSEAPARGTAHAASALPSCAGAAAATDSDNELLKSTRGVRHSACNRHIEEQGKWSGKANFQHIYHKWLSKFRPKRQANSGQFEQIRANSDKITTVRTR